MIPNVFPFRDQPLNGIDRSAFVQGTSSRPLRVWLDMDSLSNSKYLTVLRGFGANIHIELSEIFLRDISLNEHGAVLVRSNGEPTSHNVFRPYENNLIAISKSDIDLSSEPGLDRRCVLAMMAWRDGCDCLVTSNRRLSSIARKFYRESNTMTAKEAIAVVGMLLRLRGDYVISQDRGYRIATSQIDFYESLAHCLLPELPRWLAACPGNHDPLAQSPRGLTFAVLQRISRALRSRDRMLEKLFRIPTDSTADDALFYFEGLLVALCGAFDATCRVVNAIISGKRNPSWRKQPWLDQLNTAAPTLASLVLPGSKARDVIDILFVLRNLVHEEPLKAVGVTKGTRIIAYHAGVSPEEHRHLEVPIRRQGGYLRWGLEGLDANGLLLDLRRFVERLIPAACHQLSSLMAATHVENFGLKLPGTPPECDFCTDIQRIRLLGGM